MPSSPSSSGSPSHTLPPLVETFPASKYPLREIGTGFTAQSVRGVEADACAVIAAEMLSESRTVELSSVSSEGAFVALEGDVFVVPDLPLPEDAVQDGMLVLRNERLFPGMVGISLPLKGNLWVREDGTFNVSGFFRRQIPKFETGALVAATSNMDECLDVYHAMYRPVLETASMKRQFKVMRTVIEAGLQHYKQEDSPARGELVELRRRLMELRAQTGATRESFDATVAAGSQPQKQPQQDSSKSTEEVMETRRRVSDSKYSDARDESLSSGAGARDGSQSSGAGADSVGEESRNRRSSSDHERSSKIAQQVVTGAPKQKTPFRLWKSGTGEESYDKKTPS